MTQEQHKTNAAALVIDLQSFDGMSREDALAFSDALRQQLTTYRQAGIQPVWIAIAPGGSKLLQPEDGNSEETALRSIQTLEDMGFTGHQPTMANHDIYQSFINNFGPRNNEVVYRKPAMSALATPEDRQDMNRILEQAGIKLESKRDVTEDHPDTKYIEPKKQEEELNALFTEGLTLHDYLAEHNIKSTYILGAVSKYCVAETALSSAVKGYETHVVPDLVLSWSYPVTGATRGNGRLVWAEFGHQDLISKSIADAVSDPDRSFSDTDKARISGIKFEESNNHSHNALRSTFNSPGGYAAQSPEAITATNDEHNKTSDAAAPLPISISRQQPS